MVVLRKLDIDLLGTGIAKHELKQLSNGTRIGPCFGDDCAILGREDYTVTSSINR